MDVEKKTTKAIYRIDIRDLDTKKMKGFNVYKNGKKIPLLEFFTKLKEKVREIDEQ